jgi:hypothetical protein
MAEQTQQVVSAKAEDNSKDFMLTKDGVVLLGTEYLGDKLTGLVLEMVKGYAEHVSVLEFRIDNYPQDAEGPVFGMAFADTHSAAINLEHCWHRACKTAAKGEENLGFMGLLWINILSAVGHELDHLGMAGSDREQYELMRMDEEECKALEETASDEAMKLIVNLARKFNVEIPQADAFGWFGMKLQELFITDSTKDLDWVKLTQKQIADSIVYNEGEGKECKTFRQFVQLAHASDENWDEQPVVHVDMIAHLAGDVLTVSLSDAPETVVVAENIVEEPVEMVADQATGMFVGAGEGEEAATVVDDQQPEEETVVVGNPVEAAAAGMMAGVAAMGGQTAGAQMTLPGMAVEEVPLPAPVAEAQAQVVNAAATAVPPATQTPTSYAPCNMDLSMAPAVLEAVWKRLYHHVFTKCGWMQNPQTGRFYFANAAAVLEGVNIQDIITHFGADGFIMEYDTINAQGQGPLPEQCQGMIRGHLSTKQGLPVYHVYININGRRIKRVFTPQNPEKMGANNAYSKTAVESQQGHMIAWVWKDEAADNAPFNEKCAVKIVDNVYEVIS